MFWKYLLFAMITGGVFLLCICIGNVSITPKEMVQIIQQTWMTGTSPQGINSSILLHIRIPRVICACLVGAALSLCGAAMQGLLRNPLADGSTMGVTSGASLGAILSIAFGIKIPLLGALGTATMAMIFAFLSLVLILGLAYKIDHSLSTNTIILIGVIFSMFASSISSLVITFAGSKVREITFWTMGSLTGSTYENVQTLLLALVLFGGILIRYAQELNAFSMGEENARNVGISVGKVKLMVLIAVSGLIGVAVSVGGTIGFVGLIIPHMTRMLVGANHHRLLPSSIFAGAVFLMLSDLVSRMLLDPIELHIGIVTSLIGAVVFVYIFYTSRRKA